MDKRMEAAARGIAQWSWCSRAAECVACSNGCSRGGGTGLLHHGPHSLSRCGIDMPLSEPWAQDGHPAPPLTHTHTFLAIMMVVLLYVSMRTASAASAR